MRWMITDSGLGGLSVCAGLERALMAGAAGTDIELLYVNATPDDRIGYNALKTQAERIELFNRFLNAAYHRFSPDEIAIACNTLSVIYADTRFAEDCPIPVTGIVDSGVSMCTENLKQHPDHGLILFATETTTEAGTYPRLIEADKSRIVAQACPELAHAISNDASGEAGAKLLDDYISEALAEFDTPPQAVFAFLGCTHYGYHSRLFKTMIEKRGIKTSILNPNDSLVNQLISGRHITTPNQSGVPDIKFISRYEVPPVEIASMEHYLKDTAPLTLAALKNQVVIPDLFDTL